MLKSIISVERSDAIIDASAWGFLGSVLVGLFTLVGVVYSSKKAQDKQEALQDAKIDKIVEMNKMTFSHIEEEIVALTKAQQRHNNLIERTYALEKTQAEMSRDIKTLYNNVDDVKGNVREIRTNIDGLTKNMADLKSTEARLEEKIK